MKKKMPARNDVCYDDLLRVAAKGGGEGPHSDFRFVRGCLTPQA